MTRVFVGLASFNAIALFVTLVLGFMSDGRSTLARGDSLNQSQVYFTYHLLGGLGTSVLSLLVHSLAFTYFMGTGRWVDEVVAAYKMPDTVQREAKRLKSRTFRVAVISMVFIIVTAVIGAGVDTGVIGGMVHRVLAFLTIAVNLIAYYFEYTSIYENGLLLTRVMDDVKRMRKEQGLDS